MPRLLSLPLVLALAACSDAGVTQHNADPTAEITSHADGDTVREGYAVTLRGSVGDDDDALDTLSVAWLVAGVQVCADATPDATGVVTCEHVFAPAGGQVELEVSDPQGGHAVDKRSLGVVPTDAPTVVITSPAAEERYYADQLLRFSATVGDTEDAPDQLVLRWETEDLGELPLEVAVAADGTVEAFGRLPEGEHWLRLHVTDTTGKESIDSVVFDVGAENRTPSCSITAPTDGAAGALGDEVRLEGLVADADIPATDLQVGWSSSLDGALGAVAADSDGRVRLAWSTLSVGTHLLTLGAADDAGATCATSVYYTVGTPPELELLAPLDGDVVNEGEELAFEAQVSDGEDAPTALALSWVSDRDGEFSTEGADSSGRVAFRTDALRAGTHELEVTVTDTDGLATVLGLELTVNALPTAPTVRLEPDPAGTDDALTAYASGSVDPDGSGSVGYSYAWWVDGVLSGASSSAILPASATTKGETWRVVVTPDDGLGAGDAGEASLTIANTAPVLAGPTLSSGSAHRGDTLVCAASATDADPADTVTLSYRWSDGSTATAYTVGGADAPGDVLTCTVTADDGDGGVVSGSASATVVNSAPSVSVSLSPATVRTDDTLSAVVTAADADGDAVTVSYDWYVDGSLVQSGSATTLSGALWFDKGEEVVVEATADDGMDSTLAVSTGVVIANTPPGAPGVSIDPSGATAGDDLLCVVDTASTDADGDTIDYAVDWTADGVAYTAPLTTTWTDDTVDGADVGAGETWTCVVTPDDGDDAGSTGSASVTTTAASWSGTIEMPSTSTVDGFSHGEWSALNGGGRVSTQLVLTADCVNPRLAFYQHSSADTSIQGSFYVMDSAGTVLSYSSYDTYGGCNDCWLGPSSDLSVTLAAGTTYHLGFSNGSGGDMSGPSIYLDSSSRTVGIATFSSPRADKPSSPTRGLPSSAVGWQNRWRLICN